MYGRTFLNNTRSFFFSFLFRHGCASTPLRRRQLLAHDCRLANGWGLPASFSQVPTDTVGWLPVRPFLGPPKIGRPEVFRLVPVKERPGVRRRAGARRPGPPVGRPFVANRPTTVAQPPVMGRPRGRGQWAVHGVCVAVTRACLC